MKARRLHLIQHSLGRQVQARENAAGPIEAELPARVVIAADGRRSILASGLGLVSATARPRRWAVGAYFDRVSGSSSFGEMHIRVRRYLGVAPLPGGLTNACLVASLEQLRPRPPFVMRAGDGIGCSNCHADANTFAAHDIAGDELVRVDAARMEQVERLATEWWRRLE